MLDIMDQHRLSTNFTLTAQKITKKGERFLKVTIENTGSADNYFSALYVRKVTTNKEKKNLRARSVHQWIPPDNAVSKEIPIDPDAAIIQVKIAPSTYAHTTQQHWLTLWTDRRTARETFAKRRGRNRGRTFDND